MVMVVSAMRITSSATIVRQIGHGRKWPIWRLTGGASAARRLPR